MNVLVTGKDGQLGNELQNIAKNSELTYFFVGSADGDITNLEALRTVVAENKIKAIVNCAAYTAVDLAEDEEEKAFLVNDLGVQNIDKVAKEFNCKYIHISTDYVFDGTKTEPYKIADKTNPIGVYGRSKEAGEKVVINSSCEALIIRTAWVYSSYGKNFVKTMLHYGKERDELNVVDDQFGVPTYAKDLAQFIDTILTNTSKIDAQGSIYHFTNEGVITWADFAEKIMQLAHINCKINRITTEQYPTKVKRPAYSVLYLGKSKIDFGVEIRFWDEALKECLEKINSDSN